jgi:hypothetical protein
LGPETNAVEYRVLIVISARTDGLGVRLCAMLNAIILADLLQCRFGFWWPRSVRSYDDASLDEEHKKQIISQSTSPEKGMFSAH